MGAKVSRGDFEWVFTDQPHGDRRRAMLSKLICICLSFLAKLIDCILAFCWKLHLWLIVFPRNL